MYLSVMPLSLGVASIAARPQWWTVRAHASQRAIKPVYETRHLTLSITSTRLGTSDCRASWRGRCGGDQGRRRHLPTARAATSRNIFVHTMALALGTFLGDTQPATHHGESKGFLKVVWCCGMYMQIFQCGSGSPYRHWQAMPAVARSSIARVVELLELSNFHARVVRRSGQA